jgi:hypothetical protein
MDEEFPILGLRGATVLELCAVHTRSRAGHVSIELLLGAPQSHHWVLAA